MFHICEYSYSKYINMSSVCMMLWVYIHIFFPRMIIYHGIIEFAREQEEHMVESG